MGGGHMRDSWTGWLSGITLPLLFAIAWGMFGSPRAPFPLPKNGRLMLEALIFGLPGALLLGMMPVMPIIYLAGVVLNRVLIVYWKQENLIHT
ncbi:YrdB family protein [Rossellomorea marisflavi]|uniref:YrdB family protein n=1 Tax=Rossellomorea marisflavi TaxID=189381 RepID=UPI003459453A